MKKIISLFILIISFGCIHTVFAYPFNPQTPTILGGDMHMVESADFNGDGQNDLVVTDGKTMRGIGILYGNGNGTFRAPLILGDADIYEWGLAVGDIDNDGDIDIVVGNADLKQIQIYKNTGTGSRFTGAFDVIPLNDPDGTLQGDLTLADMNKDGTLDIVIGTNNMSVFEVYVNDGSGNFTYSTNGSNGASHNGKGMAAIDYNHDSWNDIVIADQGLNKVEVYRNDGSGAFMFDYDISVNQPYDVKIVDLDNDGNPEIVTTSTIDGLSVVSFDGSATYINYPGNTFYIKIADFNSDGNLDIVWSDESVVGIQVALGHGDLTFDTPVSYSVNNSPLGVAVNDFDGDGLVDTAAVNHGNTLSIFLTATLPSTPGVWVNPTPNIGNSSESGPIATSFQIGLSSEPTDIVEIGFTNPDGQVDLTKNGNPVSGVCFVPASMSTTPGISPFEPCNTWNLWQEITVTPIVDGINEGTHPGVIEFMPVISSDSNYAAVGVLQNIVTTIADENDTTAPIINSITVHGNLGASPNYSSVMFAHGVSLLFTVDELIDLTISTITMGGVPLDCTPPSTVADPYFCQTAASNLVAGTIYGQLLDNIELTLRDGSGNIGTTATRTTDGTSVLVVAPTPADITPPILTLSTSSLTVSGPFTLTITPNEPITGLVLGDIMVTNGVASALTGPDGSGNYSVTITPTTAGSVSAQIPVTPHIIDWTSNANAVGSNILTITYSVPSSGGGGSSSGSSSVTTGGSSGYIPSKIIPSQIITNPEKTTACPYFTQYLKVGDKDTKKGITEVKKVQSFLNKYLGLSIKEDGIFAQETKQAIEKYQIRYADKVLIPWKLSKPTGRWYQSTRNLANNHVGCSEGETILDNGVKVKN